MIRSHYTTTKPRMYRFAAVCLLFATSLACSLVPHVSKPTGIAPSVVPTFMPKLLMTEAYTPRPNDTDIPPTSAWIGIGPWVNIHALAIDPLTPSIIYAGTDGGLFKSTNGGESWNAINSGLSDSYIFDLAINPQIPTTIYAAIGVHTMAGGGVFKSTNGGETWSAVNNGLPNQHVSKLSIDPLIPTTLYVVTFSDGVFKTIDGGENWKEINSGLSDSDPAMLLEVDPKVPSTLYLGTYAGGVFKSINGGENWYAINDGLDLNTTYENTIRELVIDPVTSSTLYVLTSYSGVFKSTNSGQNWIGSGNILDLHNMDISTLLLDPLIPTTVYIGTSSGGIFKSTDGGETWQIPDNTGLINKPITVLVVDPLNTNILYAGTYGGGIFTNQANRTFVSIPMPSLTAPPFADTEAPVMAVPADTESPPTAIPAPFQDISSLLTLIPAEFPFTASGMLNNVKQTYIPENARLLVLWSVTTASPEYVYIFGEGSIDSVNNSFKLVFAEPPPPEALNWVGSSALGVGTIIITTDQTLASGELPPESFSEADILGASGQYSIIYVNGRFETDGLLNWYNEFNQGYSAGKGMDLPDTVFDVFEPIGPTDIEIIIDDLDNIEFPNWT